MSVRRIAAALLVVLEPLTLAFQASSWIQVIADRGPAGVGFLLTRVAVTGLGIAAGVRLWDGRAGGIVLARWCYALQLAVTAIAYSTRLWPTTLPPGVREPAFVLGLGWYAAWLVWSLRAADVDRT